MMRPDAQNGIIMIKGAVAVDHVGTDQGMEGIHVMHGMK